MRYLLKNNNTHLMVNDSHSPILQVHGKNKRYTTLDIKLDDRARQFQNITDHPIKRIIHSVDNKILQNLPIMQEDVRMDEDIYGPSIPHIKVTCGAFYDNKCSPNHP